MHLEEVEVCYPQEAGEGRVGIWQAAAAGQVQIQQLFPSRQEKAGQTALWAQMRPPMLGTGRWQADEAMGGVGSRVAAVRPQEEEGEGHLDGDWLIK